MVLDQVVLMVVAELLAETQLLHQEHNQLLRLQVAAVLAAWVILLQELQ